MNTSDEIRFSLSEVPRRTTTGTAVGDIGIELAARGSEGDSFSEPYGHENEPAPPPCFKCEYDVKEERYVIREPNVIVPGQDKPIEPEDPGELHKNRTYVCAVTRENNKVKAEIVEEDKVPDDALVSVPICKIDDSRGFDIITQYHVGAIVLGGTTFVGDMDGSEVIGGAGEEILVTGHPGAEDPSGQDSHSGIQFLTVSSREDGVGTTPAKLIARIKGKDENEDWGAKTMTVTDNGGSQQIIHFLGCGSVDIDLSGGGGGGGGGGDSVVGSDYIKVEDEQDAQDAEKKNKAIKAKINTPNAVPSADEDKHALLTNDTGQNVRSAKTFLGRGQPSSSDRIIIDGPNAKLQAKSSDGNKTVEVDAAAGKETLTNGSKKIVLDPSAIPDECQKKEVSVKTLKVVHRYSKNGKASETYHILGCDDVEIDEGDIKKLTFKKTGSPDVEFDGTEDKDVEMTVRNLVAGSGISLTTSGNNITITNTAQGGGGGGGGGSEDGITGDVPFLDGFQYDKVNHKLQYRFGLMTFEKGILVGVKQGQIHGMNFEDVPGGDAVEETV